MAAIATFGALISFPLIVLPPLGTIAGAIGSLMYGRLAYSAVIGDESHRDARRLTSTAVYGVPSCLVFMTSALLSPAGAVMALAGLIPVASLLILARYRRPAAES